MTRFMLLIHGDHDAWETMGVDEIARLQEGHRLFAEAAGAAIVDSGELESSSTAVTLRSRDRGMGPTAGPFAETREVVGGFYVIDVAEQGDAVRLARLLPETTASYTAGVEVRPLVDHG